MTATTHRITCRLAAATIWRPAFLCTLVAMAGLGPPAHGAVVGGVFTQIAVQHTGAKVEPGGDGLPVIVEWDRVEQPAKFAQATVGSELKYTTTIDDRLTMKHEAYAFAEIVKGQLQFGQQSSGPSLKVSTDDILDFDGKQMWPGEGATWARSVSELDASAYLKFDLSILPTENLPSRIVFHWQLDGIFQQILEAPQSMAPGVTNPLSIVADRLESQVKFTYGQLGPGCTSCIQAYELDLGISPGDWKYLWYDYVTNETRTRYGDLFEMDPTFISVAFDVENTLMTDLAFGLDVASVHDLSNIEYGNILLAATMASHFNNSATLLGIEALDPDGRTMTGVRYAASDPDLVLPVWGERSAVVPEPASLGLVGLALFALALDRCRGRRRRVTVQPPQLADRSVLS